MHGVLIMALRNSDQVFITPDRWADVVPVLIDLADHPDHVATSTDNGFQIRIPAYLAARYDNYLALQASEPAEQEPPAPRKRGRPRKVSPTSPDEE